MTQHRFVFSFAWIAALLIATPAVGQLINFPVLALAPGDADGATSVGAGWARGLNDDSNKQSAFGAGFQRAMERVSFGASAGYVATDTDELTLAGSVGVHVLPDNDAPVQVTVQSGLGWMSIDGTPDNTSLLNIPVGVAIQSNNDSPVSAWVMPRINFLRDSSGGVSNTESKFGASAGAAYTSEGGVGVGVAFDLQRAESLPEDVSRVGFLAYVFYALP